MYNIQYKPRLGISAFAMHALQRNTLVASAVLASISVYAQSPSYAYALPTPASNFAINGDDLPPPLAGMPQPRVVPQQHLVFQPNAVSQQSVVPQQSMVPQQRLTPQQRLILQQQNLARMAPIVPPWLSGGLPGGQQVPALEDTADADTGQTQTREASQSAKTQLPLSSEAQPKSKPESQVRPATQPPQQLSTQAKPVIQALPVVIPTTNPTHAAAKPRAWDVRPSSTTSAMAPSPVAGVQTGGSNSVLNYSATAVDIAPQRRPEPQATGTGTERPVMGRAGRVETAPASAGSAPVMRLGAEVPSGGLARAVSGTQVPYLQTFGTRVQPGASVSSASAGTPAAAPVAVAHSSGMLRPPVSNQALQAKQQSSQTVANAAMAVPMMVQTGFWRPYTQVAPSAQTASSAYRSSVYQNYAEPPQALSAKPSATGVKKRKEVLE